MGAEANGQAPCTPTVAHHLVHHLVHRLVHHLVHLLSVVAPTFRTGTAPKGTRAASMCRTSIAHQLDKRVLDGTKINGAPSLGMQIVRAVLLLMLAADVAAASTTA